MLRELPRDEKEEKGLKTHLVPREMEARGVDEESEEMGPLLYHSYIAPGPQSLYAGCNFPSDSPQMQNSLPNGTGCALVSVNSAISFPHFRFAQLASESPFK